MYVTILLYFKYDFKFLAFTCSGEMFFLILLLKDLNHCLKEQFNILGNTLFCFIFCQMRRSAPLSCLSNKDPRDGQLSIKTGKLGETASLLFFFKQRPYITCWSLVTARLPGNLTCRFYTLVAVKIKQTRQNVLISLIKTFGATPFGRSQAGRFHSLC